MTELATALELEIDFEASCSDACRLFAEPLFAQLSSGHYDYPASAMLLPTWRGDWELAHKTARKRAMRAERFGYTFAEIDRRQYVDEIFAINTSSPERQGRPMAPAYLERPAYSPLAVAGCPRHRIYTYGVLSARGRLYAYSWVYRCGELVMISSILGHADRLDDGIMYLLVRDAIEAQRQIGPGVAFYNRHDSGTDGLRWQKERLGFGPARIRWELG